ncbi:MAG: serine hydrolase domain-containing protein [Pseudonocardiaceae bacterium]
MPAARHTARSATGIAAPISELLQGGIDARVYPGVVWAVGDTGGWQASGALGVLDPTNPSRPMTTDTVFDVASLTKIMAVWALVGMLWESGTLALDDPLAALVPELDGYPLGPVTVHQLLTHTAGVPLRANLRALYGTDPAAIRCGVFQEQLHRPPGEAVEYTDRAALILGFLIERLTGRGLDDTAHEHLWAPLGMTETRFGPLPPHLAARCAPTELEEQTGVHLKGIVHDFSARLLGGVCGIAGVFSTLVDTEKFLRYLLDPTVTSGAPSFGSGWVAESLQPHTGHLEPVRGLFWLPAPGTDPADDIYVHYGFTGTGMWISPKQRRWAVLLTNKLYFSREHQPLTDIRNTFRELVFALGER